MSFGAGVVASSTDHELLDLFQVFGRIETSIVRLNR